MADLNGRFVWYELMTSDVDAARAFYTQVVGWGSQDSQMPGMQYWLLTMDGQQLAGMMSLEHVGPGTPPSWMGYVGVDNVDATATAVSANGGTVQVLPTDIPNVGRFAVVADPAGAVFALLQPSNPDQQPVPDQEAPGRVGWHELYGADPASGFDFYARLFGWQKTDAMDMGEMGVYQMFGKGDAALGGMMKKPPEMPVACWGYYFNVGNIDQAAARVTAGGGQILQGPMEVPGGQFILQGMDPQGAAFALAGTR